MLSLAALHKSVKKDMNTISSKDKSVTSRMPHFKTFVLSVRISIILATIHWSFI